MSSEGTPLADRLLDALGSRDAGKLRALCSPGFRHWINVTGDERGIDELAAILDIEAKIITGGGLRIHRVITTDEAIVVQATADTDTKGGLSLSVPVCLVATVTGGKISRLEEYVSSGHIEPLVREITETAKAR